MAVSASGPAAHPTAQRVAAELDQVAAMARLAHENALVVHVLVGRAPGVVEYARQVARELGLGCSADLRARFARIRFAPPNSAS
jgi:DNA-binding IclR family transcriptional regulator